MPVYVINTHKHAIDHLGRAYIQWKSRNTPFARTAYKTVGDACMAVRDYDPGAIFLGEARYTETNVYFITYVGPLGTYIIEEHDQDPYVIPQA